LDRVGRKKKNKGDMLTLEGVGKRSPRPTYYSPSEPKKKKNKVDHLTTFEWRENLKQKKWGGGATKTWGPTIFGVGGGG